MLFSFRAPRCSTCSQGSTSQGSTHGLTATTGAHSSPGSGDRLRSPAERGPGREAAPLPRDRHRHGASRHRCASLGSPEHFLAQLPAKKLTEQAMSLSRRPSLRSCTVEFLKFADSC
ncbi:Hypothetical protein RMHFA_03999 [Roseomonas mucosa]|nr:Hypothetical protein RMHFA_03999 [Roseomonas mucosa]